MTDYLNDSPELIQHSKDLLEELFVSIKPEKGYPSRYIEIAHDIHNQTAYNLTEWTLQRLQSLNLTSITVGDCLGDPQENWYRSAGGAEPSAAVNQETLVSDFPVFGIAHLGCREVKLLRSQLGNLTICLCASKYEKFYADLNVFAAGYNPNTDSRYCEK